MIVEKVTITRDKLTVSYSGLDQYLTPELEARLAAYWKDRLDRITAAVLGCPVVPERERFGTFKGNDPDREQVPENRRFGAFVFPLGN